ncbi:hypothetical protein AGABI1DRAFT_115735 [Agaricus bisporus var. burnettii JB137-S8]|uniref:T6SS Phospholipase effector Tle1-like catalytic domain-containing protein n=2 Tax=Agaricus bisporus var. burnettii TaxID=192524 RepID=K5XPL2_AGABU|nr:uncharacterized protein AGABI1DRAFT_115735 [Agaricus bisporus var. burnettii JB137-S8]EKM76650.1 hypothetical protein AGABI1DRAFT_115735 [Agaricus bisporus var. burnettii JB137-S8]KAF7759925.1 hypothetical protein Agabi119p4_11620 [Agaricus bisporus var. burnettii]
MADQQNSILPVEAGPNEVPDTHHTRSPTSISFVPSETATLSGGAGSGFTTGKGAPLEGLPEVGPLPPTTQPSGEHRIPNIFVPEKRKNRTLVLCFDGTGDQFDNDNSNIVELFSILKKDDPDNQMVYYQAGIGTYTVPQIATPLMAKISKTLDEMIAWNLDAHIMGGYEFLMQNYKAGDKICIFGFSRGAYTARCLAGMIHKVGLLPACNHQQVPFAYKMYTRTDALGWKQSNAFKAAFSCHVDIYFLGVWDTVNSVGLFPRRLPFTTSNTCVRVFRHAIALDERRAKFKQNGWNAPSRKELSLAKSDGVPAANNEEDANTQHGHHPSVGREKKNGKMTQRRFEREYSDIYEKPSDVEEVWFAGCHCDVGGGSVTNGIRPNLARIPLRWMIRQAFETETGILFSARGLRHIGIDLDQETWCPTRKSPSSLKVPEGSIIDNPKPPARLTDEEHDKLVHEMAAEEHYMPEEEIDLRDALSPIYDQLSLAPYWWALELFPIKQRYQKSDNTWASSYGFNLGRGRRIPRQNKQGVKVHRSVQWRMEATHASGEKYSPKANLKLDKVTWVD